MIDDAFSFETGTKKVVVEEPTTYHKQQISLSFFSTIFWCFFCGFACVDLLIIQTK